MQFLHGYDSDGVFQRLHFTSAEQRGDCREAGWGEKGQPQVFQPAFLSNHDQAEGVLVLIIFIQAEVGRLWLIVSYLWTLELNSTVSVVFFLIFFSASAVICKWQVSAANLSCCPWGKATGKESSTKYQLEQSGKEGELQNQLSPSCGTAVSHWMDVHGKGVIWNSRDWKAGESFGVL